MNERLSQILEVVRTDGVTSEELDAAHDLLDENRKELTTALASSNREGKQNDPKEKTWHQRLELKVEASQRIFNDLAVVYAETLIYQARKAKSVGCGRWGKCESPK
ncbi:MAG: hypothetical protein H7Z43_12420 [Clostridia bacterium]|nr:hypothetical protein [Deltaproteobacteria bacterium]